MEAIRKPLMWRTRGSLAQDSRGKRERQMDTFVL